MAVELDEIFLRVSRCIVRDLELYPEEEKKRVACFLKFLKNNVQTDDDRLARNEYASYLHCIIRKGEDLPDELGTGIYKEDRPFINDAADSSSRGPSARKDTIAQLESPSYINSIEDLIQRVNNGEISTAAEFIFMLAPFVPDQGVALQEILEKDLTLFREIVEEIIDRRIQDEADVMMHTQNDIKQKLNSSTEGILQRTTRIKERLHDISPKFDWASDGKDKVKINRLVRMERKQAFGGDSAELEKKMHQVFMRGQWLKKELNRLLEENATLKTFLKKYRKLAAERKALESHVPRLLCEQKKSLERELKAQRKTYRVNLEIIDALYVEHNRCIRPPSESKA